MLGSGSQSDPGPSMDAQESRGGGPRTHTRPCPEPGRPRPAGGPPPRPLGAQGAGRRPAPGAHLPRSRALQGGVLGAGTRAGRGRRGRRPEGGGRGGQARRARSPRAGRRAGAPRGEAAGKGPSAAPHRAARPRARCGRRAIHTPSGHSARRGGGGRRFNGDFAGRRRGWGRGPAAGAARCYAVAAGPAARARRPHYAGNAV